MSKQDQDKGLSHSPPARENTMTTTDRIDQQAIALGYEIERSERELLTERLRQLAIVLCISIAINVVAIIWSLS